MKKIYVDPKLELASLSPDDGVMLVFFSVEQAKQTFIRDVVAEGSVRSSYEIWRGKK